MLTKMSWQYDTEISENRQLKYDEWLLVTIA